MKNNDILFSKIDYQFYLSEIKYDNEDLGYFVELTRVVDHIQQTRDLLSFTDTELIDNEDVQIELEAKYDRIRTYLFIISAAQLRESLKLIGKFFKSKFYALIELELSQNSKELVKYFKKIMQDYDEKKGILTDILIPIRNKIFHFDTKSAEKWVDEIKNQELQRKPHFQSLNLNPLNMNLGIEYNNTIYANNLVYNKGIKSFLASQREVWAIEEKLGAFVKSIIAIVMSKSDIEKHRKPDWFMKYWHGYRD